MAKKKVCLDQHTQEEEEEDFNQQFCTYLQQEFGVRTTNLRRSWPHVERYL
jgi:hypothetical protein